MAVNEIPCLENVGPVDSDTRSLEEKCNIKHLESVSDKDGLQPEESDENSVPPIAFWLMQLHYSSQNIHNCKSIKLRQTTAGL